MIKNSKILLGAVLTVFILLLIFWAFLFRSIGGLSEEIGLIKGRIMTLDLELKNLKVLENFLSDTAPQREEISGGFVSENELIDFIEDLEGAGGNVGTEVKVESATFSGDKEASVPSFRLQASGSFDSLFKLMLVLENLPYEIDFEDLSFTKSSADGKTSSWNGVFIIKLLSYES